MNSIFPSGCAGRMLLALLISAVYAFGQTIKSDLPPEELWCPKSTVGCPKSTGCKSTRNFGCPKSNEFSRILHSLTVTMIFPSNCASGWKIVSNG